MPANPLHIALYSQNTFDVQNPNQQQIDAMVAAAQNINSSGFGTVLLGQWHVHSDGSLYYNDSPLDTVIQALKVIPTALKLGGSVQKVLLSFGPFGDDFKYIQQNLALFQKTVAGIQAMTDIDGLDWDLEQDYDQFTDLLVTLTKWANTEGMMVTAAPYDAYYETFWTGVLKQTNTGGSAGFSWWNLQLYGGAIYSDWVGYINGLVPNPESFLVPGYSVNQGATPSSVENDLSQIQQSFPSLDGGFIWQYEDIIKAGYTPAQYASAIATGLGGKIASAKG
jgi:hypothetical protein